MDIDKPEILFKGLASCQDALSLKTERKAIDMVGHFFAVECGQFLQFGQSDGEDVLEEFLVRFAQKRAEPVLAERSPLELVDSQLPTLPSGSQAASLQASPYAEQSTGS